VGSDGGRSGRHATDGRAGVGHNSTSGSGRWRPAARGLEQHVVDEWWVDSRKYRRWWA